MNDLRIALVQMQVSIGEVRKNREKMAAFVEEAAGKKVEMILFPELCIQGYHREKIQEFAEPIPGESTNYLSRLASSYNMVILAGLAEMSGCEKPYITQVIAYPDGRLDKYRKTHLGKSEKPYFTPGNQLPVFETDKARFAVEICWDLHFPEVTTVLSLQGAEVIFAPHASPTMVGDRRDIWLKYLSARAYDNSVFIAACNLVGPSGKNQEFCGGALVIDPKGNVVAEDFEGKEGLLVVDLDSKLINTIRYNNTTSMRHSFFLESRRPELYGLLVKPGLTN
ncbi:nitrilase family protein [Desulfofundulus thermocisternus]|jgi:predicted amidohydrolase|uniref:nitrilase family protein n=1 Tax=Desulfofundulus thermocisternus TaxID=42471 RepID=UPI0004821E86|nr:nitrilase family protein [Desulfofundulus thermocisternus]